MTNKRSFLIPREGEIQETTARQYVARAWPEATPDQIQSLFDAGGVEADDVLITRPDSPLASKTRVEFEVPESGNRPAAIPEPEVLVRGDQWIIVDKPVGMPGRLTDDDPTDPIRFLADTIGINRQHVQPVWPMPTGAGGPWLIAENDEVATRISDQIAGDELRSTWVALTTRPPQTTGTWKTELGTIQFATTRTESGLAELQLTPRWSTEIDEPYTALLTMAADAGHPLLGDPFVGGYLVDGGIRLRLAALYGVDEFAHSWSAPRHWWPDVPVVSPVAVPGDEAPEKSGDERTIENLRVTDDLVARLDESDAPWIGRHEITEGLERFDPGDLVELVGPSGPSGAFALVDATGPVAARLFGRTRSAATRFEEELGIRLDEAIGRRRALFGGAEDDVFRVVHGEADGFPGLAIDRFGPVWRVATTARCFRRHTKTVVELLHRRDPAATIVECDDPSTFRIPHPGTSDLDPRRMLLRVDGLRYWIDATGSSEPDFSPPQRDNRRRAVERAAPGQSWLDLRGRNGAFCAVLAAHDVETTNVDPQGRYFDRLDATFELNDLPRASRHDVEAAPLNFLEETQSAFDAILVDLDAPAVDATDEPGPEALLEAAFRQLSTDGWLLVCRLPGRTDDGLDALLRRAAQSAGHSIDTIESGAPSGDYPTIDDFPQGTAFEGRWVR